MKSLLVGLFAIVSTNVFAYGIGQSSFPLMPNKRLISTEMTGITSTNGGVGIQSRYTQKLNAATTLDAGLGISGGERSGRIFAGADYEVYPDYQRQPRISLKGTIENAKEFGKRRNIISIAPIISKGFSFWGQEAYPYLALPLGISLEGREKRYKTFVSSNLGINGRVPIDGYRHLTGMLETQINLNGSFTGVTVGMSFPVN